MSEVHTAGIPNPRGRALQEFAKALADGDLKLYPTNVAYIDDLACGGLPRRAVVIVGGQTNVGKTALVYGWIHSQAVANPNFTALAFNCEMDNATMMARGITQILNANGHRVDMNDLCAGQQAQEGIELYREKIGDRIEMYDNVLDQGQIMNIIEKNVEYNQAQGLDTPYIIIDYLQKFKKPQKNQSDYNATNDTVTWLTNISKTFKTVVIALTSMNRSANNDRKGDTNMLNGASGSGDIEYSADYFMYITGMGEHGRKLEMLKTRRGEKGKNVVVDFDGAHMTFNYKSQAQAQNSNYAEAEALLLSGLTLNRTGQKTANDLTGRKRK